MAISGPREDDAKLTMCSAPALAQAVTRGEVSEGEVLDGHLTPIAEVNSRVKAIVDQPGVPREDRGRGSEITKQFVVVAGRTPPSRRDPSGRQRLPPYAVGDVRRLRRVDHIDRLEPWILYIFEQRLAGPE
jgi:hypothetical protein